MRKPRSDAFWHELTDSQLCELRDMLIRGASQPATRAWLAEECGVTVRSDSSISRFWEQVCVPYLAFRNAEARKAAKAIGAAADRHGSDWEPAIIEALQQRTFELITNPSADPSKVFLLVAQVLKKRDQDLQRDKLHQKIREFEAKMHSGRETMANTTLSTAEREARLREIFGI